MEKATEEDLVNDFTGRVAIITGAARGLGRAAAERLHERGAAVAVNVRDRVRAESVAKSIGERALAVPGDIAVPGVPEEIVRQTLERFAASTSSSTTRPLRARHAFPSSRQMSGVKRSR